MFCRLLFEELSPIKSKKSKNKSSVTQIFLLEHPYPRLLWLVISSLVFFLEPQFFQALPQAISAGIIDLNILGAINH